MSEALLWLGKLLPMLLMPLPAALLLLGVALWPRGTETRRRVLAGVAAALLLIASSPLFSRAITIPLERAHPPLAADARAPFLVLLGGATLPAAPPRPTVELGEEADRVVYAARLWRDGRAAKILVCGGRLDASDRAQSEADEMADLLIVFGVPRDSLILERTSRTTFENAVEAKRLLAPLGVQRVVLVTSALHMPRAVGVFRAQGFEVVPAPTDYRIVDLEWPASVVAALRRALAWSVPSASALDLTTTVLHEWIGLLVYRLQGRLG